MKLGIVKPFNAIRLDGPMYRLGPVKHFVNPELQRFTLPMVLQDLLNGFH